ncbi:CGNR zinc finger domain-containing protein [Longispora albida]|uniref:CGNR zinc finger domain-containing protein n=1 Tax=Longispora albida TaxID=203523 RepID=UPI0003674B3D|nr:CGNR zinc finger domain-containing protein [Longispora albida]
MDRPLIGEPLPLDLVNTEWYHAGVYHDLLEQPGDAAGWIGGYALGDGGIAPLRQTRAALRSALAGDPAPLNDVLSHGRIAPYLTTEGPEERVVIDEPEWELPWRAAVSYLDLVKEYGDRIRPCTNPDCILWFVDISRNRGRRWCSMAGCGNRAKARSFYARKTS